MTVTTSVKEISLLLTPENRQSVKAGSKTQTRRLIKLPSWSTQDWDDVEINGDEIQAIAANTGCFSTVFCPYGKKGDRFYLLEPTQVLRMGEGKQVLVRWLDNNNSAWVDVSEQDVEKLEARKDWSNPCSSRFMLKSFARNWFVNDGVRVQRLQEISEIDCEAELGVEPYSLGNDAYPRFRQLWDSINAKRCPWSSNPWVWVISFKRAGQ